MVLLTDGTGNVTKDYEYDAFGNEKNIDAADTNAYRYCGEYFDRETGDIYLRARYYNPGIGRFIIEDNFTGNISDYLIGKQGTDYLMSMTLALYDNNGQIYRCSDKT